MVAHFYLGTWPGLVLAAALLAFGVTLHLINVGSRAWATSTAGPSPRGSSCSAMPASRSRSSSGWRSGSIALWPFLPGSVLPHPARPRSPGAPRLSHADGPRRRRARVSDVPARSRARRPVRPGPALGTRPRRARRRGGAGARLPRRCRWPAPSPSPAPPAATSPGWPGWRGVGERPRLDWGLRFALTGAAFVVPGALLGLGLALDLILGPSTRAGVRGRRPRRLDLAHHRRHDAQDRAVPRLVPRLRLPGGEDTGADDAPSYPGRAPKARPTCS